MRDLFDDAPSSWKASAACPATSATSASTRSPSRRGSTPRAALERLVEPADVVVGRGIERGAVPASGPAITASISAASATVRVIGPVCEV